MEKEDIFQLVGGAGPWQKRILAMETILSIPLAFHVFSLSFFAPNQDFWCAQPLGTNWTVTEWKTYGLPLADQKCSRYEFLNLTAEIRSSINRTATSNVVACDAWEYDETTYGSTVLSQWNLVCSHEWLISMCKSIFTGGFLFSVVCSGFFSDKFGRRRVIAICNLISLISAVIGAFSVSFVMFSVSRFFTAVGVAGSYTTGYVLLTEVFAPAHRSFYGIIGSTFGWVFGHLTLPIIAWLIKDWVWIQLMITVPFVIFLPMWWLLPESPRWLLANGKEDEALEVLMTVGRVNNKSTADLRNRLKTALSKTNKTRESDYSTRKVLRLLWTSGLWKRALIIYYLWFVTSFAYYAISHNTNDLAGNPYINFAAAGAVEIPAVMLLIFVTPILGRRNPLAFSLSTGGIACLLVCVIPEDPWWTAVVISIFGKFCFQIGFAILYLFTTEIFPTTVRNFGLGSGSMCARFGSILAPFVRELAHATHPAVPQIIFGMLAIVGGFFTLFLPETNNQKVPDTIDEAAGVNK